MASVSAGGPHTHLESTIWLIYTSTKHSQAWTRWASIQCGLVALGRGPLGYSAQSLRKEADGITAWADLPTTPDVRELILAIGWPPLVKRHPNGPEDPQSA